MEHVLIQTADKTRTLFAASHAPMPVLRGAQQILPFSDTLREFAGRCDQEGAMHGLESLLETEELNRKLPMLLLAPADPATFDRHRFEADQLAGFVLTSEYRWLGLPTGIFSTQDISGFRSVIAKDGECESLALAATSQLLCSGARVVMMTARNDSFQPGEGMLDALKSTVGRTGQRGRLALRTRVAEQLLELGETMDATLRKLGKHTRANLRYYRRRLEADFPCEFIPDAAPLLTAAQLRALNARSLNRIRTAEFDRDCAAVIGTPGGFLCGLRRSTGEWLSLIGGWRHGGTSVIDWQLNVSGYENYSLTTAMRSFFLEHEIGIGMRRLRIIGGTPHSMQHSFTRHPVTDLLVLREDAVSSALHASARAVRRTFAYRRRNFLLEWMADPATRWHGF